MMSSTATTQPEGFRLISFVCETDADLLPHFVRWYRRLGVDRFHFVMHGKWSRESLTMLAGLPGVECSRWVTKPFCKSLKCDEITAIARRHVGEWVVIADADELLEMPARGLKEMVEALEAAGSEELYFFNATAPRFGLNTLDDYAALFNDNNKLQGEVCPSSDRPRPIASIAEAIPDAKLILICREPVSRLESSVNHMMQWHAECPDMDDFFGWSPLRSFEANLQAELADAGSLGLLQMGLYADTVQRVLSRFPPEQLLILVAEEYRQNPQATYDRIAAFLGLRPTRISHEDAHVRNYTTRLTAEQRAWLSDFYRPHNQRFFELLGREIPSWGSDYPRP